VRYGSLTGSSRPVHEIWYRPDDATCCPSIKATTVCRYVHGAFAPVSTVQE
jgi:hypothetical protein